MTTSVDGAQYPPIDYFTDHPPIEDRTEIGWEELARFKVAESGTVDEESIARDVPALAAALRASADRERALRADTIAGWSAIEEQAYAEDEQRSQEMNAS